MKGLKAAGRALAVVVVAGLFALLALRVVHRGEGSGIAAALSRGDTPVAPDFVLPRLDRTGTLSLRSLRGRVVVLNFWASWCVPCREEAPRLQAGWERWRSQGVVFVGVDAQDFASDARRFMRRYGITYPVVRDGPGGTLGRYGVTGFPETFFVDRDGRLVGERVEGPVTAERLDENIEGALR